MADTIIKILESLVACDTQNPPRTIAPSHPIFSVIQEQLPSDFRFDTNHFDEGRVNLLARRGDSTLLFNVHLDTVPVGDGWTQTPLTLTQLTDRVIGRGVCDIKGAAACLIEAARTSDASNIAILFSTDEEGSNSCCIDQFCQSDLAATFEQVIVAEPTECQAVVGHRGYLSVRMEFTGEAAHTSQHQLLHKSANHRASKWISQSLQRVEQFEQQTLGGQSACFNVGRIDGGVKNNMIADHCTVTWSARLPGGFPNGRLLENLKIGHESVGQPIDSKVTFDGAPFPRSLQERERSLAWCKQNELPLHADVDFWTEAAIFSTHGNSSIVLGPGNIAQAHTPDEWVSIEQLENCTHLYRNLMKSHSTK